MGRGGLGTDFARRFHAHDRSEPCMPRPTAPYQETKPAMAKLAISTGNEFHRSQ